MTSKRIISSVLALAMTASMLPTNLTAVAGDPPATVEIKPDKTKEDLQGSGSMTITLSIPLKDAAAENFDYTAPTALTYDGTNKTATVTAKDSVTGMGEVTVHYYSDADCTTEVTETKNVGTYYVGITLAAGTHYGASTSVIHRTDWKFEIIKSTPDAPDAPTMASSTKNSITLATVEGCEYSKDGTNWQDSPTFTGLTPSTSYTFYQRVKGTTNNNVSANSQGKSISTTADTYGMTITLKIGDLKVKIGDHDNGTLKLKDKAENTDITNAASGDLITVKATPDSGYRLSSLTYTADGASQSVTIPEKDSDYEFTMPDKDVTVNAVFTKIGGGSVDYETVTDGGITYHVYSDHAEVAEADTAIETAAIKDKVDGKNVTVIAENAFNSCKSLTDVKIPDSMTEIDANAFWGCTSLESLTIPKTVTTIDKTAFSHCTAFKTIYGYTGSTAEEFAKANNIEFVALDAQPEETLGIAKAPTVDEQGVVSWSPVENAVKYRIVKEYGGKTYLGKETTETSYQQNNTNVLDKHKIYIRSYDADGNYTNGEILTVPAKVGIAKAPTVDSEGVVTWKPVTNAVKYKIVKEYGGKTYFGKDTLGLSYKQNSVPSVEYKVYIRAFGEDDSYTDGEVTTITEKTLGKVAAPTVAKDGTVTWTAAKNAVKYKVVKIVNGVYYGGSVVTGTSYKFKNIPVSDYKVYVIAYGEDNAKTIGAKTTVEVDNALGFVNDVTVDENGKVTWTKADNATSYRVVKIVGGNKYYCKETKNTNYTFAVKPIRDYQVYVIAYNANKKYTAGKSITVEVGTLGTVLDPKVDKNGTVTWTAARNAVKYKVGKTANGKTYYSDEITDTSYTFKNVATKDYKVFVVAFDKDGNKTWGWKVDVKVN